MILSLTPNLTIRVQRTADHALRRVETRSRHFFIRCWTLYGLEVTLFRYQRVRVRR